MKTLDQIKEEVAQENGFTSFEQLIKIFSDLNKLILLDFMFNQVAELYALQFHTPIESVNNYIITDSDGKALKEGQDYKMVECFHMKTEKELQEERITLTLTSHR